MSERPLVLTLSASDSAGIAGMAMDLRTQHAMGVHGLSVTTANTAQNNLALTAINPVVDSVLQTQLEAVAEYPFRCIKLGLLASASQIDIASNFLQNHKTSVVLDPVMGSSSGYAFVTDDMCQLLVQQLLPKVTLLTPNIPEAEKLSGMAIQSWQDVEAAAASLLALGVEAVLIKGGHFEDESSADTVSDYFSDGIRSFYLHSPRIQSPNSRGTGCALASAIASSLAIGYSLYDAVVIGKMAINQGLRQGYAVSHEQGSNTVNTNNRGPVCIQQFPNTQQDLPILTTVSLRINFCSKQSAFPLCNQKPLGVYPVVDRADWIERLAATGISTMQLRVKDLSDDRLEQEIAKAIVLAKQFQVRLFINDYWQQAIRLGAYGVHLGQEDLDDADIDAIKESGLRLGISTHCHYEVARAHAYSPSYIACGPVYHTTTKDMPWVPHGLDGLAYWRQVLDYPLVAIGGINRERFPCVTATGVDSVAMITAITEAESPEKVAGEFVSTFVEQQATALKKPCVEAT